MFGAIKKWKVEGTIRLWASRLGEKESLWGARSAGFPDGFIG